MVFKLISVGVFIICAIIAFLIKYFLPEAKYKNDPMQRIKILVRVRVICFVLMLILLFICIVI